jgi:hypothetical protein
MVGFTWKLECVSPTHIRVFGTRCRLRLMEGANRY